MEIGTLVSLALYFIAMLGIGLYAYRTSTDDVSGYMLGGRKLSPGLTALSAGASDMSGWLLMGLPGAVFISGFSNMWLGLGLFLGAFANYILVAPRLRVYTEVAKDAITLPEFFENRFEDGSRLLRVIPSVVIIIFFTLYTSSGVVAGGKLFESSFGLSYELGLYITAGVVVTYTLFGGFLAVSMTDFVQGCIMFVALIMVPIVAFFDFSSTSELMSVARGIDPTLTSITSGITIVGIISAMSWGLGYFGQPHVIVRFMAIRSVGDVKTARRIGMSWMFVSVIGALSTGFIGLAYMTKNGLSLEDPETIFIVLSQLLFHPLIGGFLLAAILAAIMSTISSQLLVSSSSLTEDFYKLFVRRSASQKELVLIGRLSVVAVALVAIGFAYDRSSSVLSLVSNAWAGFGAAFGPLVVMSLFWKRMNAKGAIAGMIAGAVTVLLWIYGPITIGGAHSSAVLYEIIPGVIVSTLTTIIVSLLTAPPGPGVRESFAKMEKALEDGLAS
ncbi:sodium/proline symporter PutP [Kordiimonas gwangyangensis]|uniref:sodium/proline symporter PutP n=1 Tax=Kordiimonas gwangyangensis TaxID=288022 RepID=UPI00036A8FE0|nr:sodium/proline symporter PutP [Kordiimonas gwangyangensis]